MILICLLILHEMEMIGLTAIDNYDYLCYNKEIGSCLSKLRRGETVDEDPLVVVRGQERCHWMNY